MADDDAWAKHAAVECGRKTQPVEWERKVVISLLELAPEGPVEGDSELAYAEPPNGGPSGIHLALSHFDRIGRFESHKPKAAVLVGLQFARAPRHVSATEVVDQGSAFCTRTE